MTGERHPLKQGLKHDPVQVNVVVDYTGERHPLKQGLKHGDVQFRLTGVTITGERHPLKQGLKHDQNLPSVMVRFHWRKTSTKTRIETLWRSKEYSVQGELEKDIH